MNYSTRANNLLRLITAVLLLLVSVLCVGPVAASGPVKLWSGIHLGNRPAADWNSTLLARVDGDRGGIWPKAVVFLSSQLYNISRDANCRIKTSASDVTTGRPVLLDYLQRASQNGVHIIIRIHPSPGNFDANHRLISGPIAGIGYCNPLDHRPAFDLADEIKAIHNYNQAQGISEWGFEPANEPNIEWYSWNDIIQPNFVEAWQDMNTYFRAVWTNVPMGIRTLTPPMSQGVFAENNFTDANAINAPNPLDWCSPMRLRDGTSTGYGTMESYYRYYNDGISWHNYWRAGFELSGHCSVGAQHVSFYFPQWMKDILESGAKPGIITEADLFSYGSPPHQDPRQPIQDKDVSEGSLAANSLRKFFQKEIRASVLVSWLLNDNVNDPNTDHNWHEAYNDQWGDYERPWFSRWWFNSEQWVPPVYLPLQLRDYQ